MTEKTTMNVETAGDTHRRRDEGAVGGWPPQRQSAPVAKTMERLANFWVDLVLLSVWTAIAWWRVGGFEMSWWWAPIAVILVTLPWEAMVQPALAYRRYWWDVAGDTLIVRDGFYVQRTHVTMIDRVQSVAYESSWLQRRFGLASVICESLGKNTTIANIKHDDAERLTAYLSSVIRAVDGDGS